MYIGWCDWLLRSDSRAVDNLAHLAWDKALRDVDFGSCSQTALFELPCSSTILITKS